MKRWLDEIGARPAVKKAMALGPEFREDPASISDEEQAPRPETGRGPAGAEEVHGGMAERRTGMTWRESASLERNRLFPTGPNPASPNLD